MYLPINYSFTIILLFLNFLTQLFLLIYYFLQLLLFYLIRILKLILLILYLIMIIFFSFTVISINLFLNLLFSQFKHIYSYILITIIQSQTTFYFNFHIYFIKINPLMNIFISINHIVLILM